MKLQVIGIIDDATLVAVTETVPCRCGRAAVLLVNRRGETRCVPCDTKFQQLHHTESEQLHG